MSYSHISIQNLLVTLVCLTACSTRTPATSRPEATTPHKAPVHVQAEHDTPTQEATAHDRDSPLMDDGTLISSVSGGQGVANTRHGEGQKAVVAVTSATLDGVSESCDEEAAIDKVVQARLKALNFCYDQALQNAPELQGSASITWEIGKDGKVFAVRDDEEPLPGMENVLSCVKGVIKRMRFEALTTPGCLITYTLAHSSTPAEAK
jgi:hypothetical protein